MAPREYKVEDRTFRTESDYKLALRDKATMDALRRKSETYSKQQLEQLLEEIGQGTHRFYTLLGQDFADEVRDRIRQLEKKSIPAEKKKQGAKKQDAKKRGQAAATVSDEAVAAELKKQEKRRKWTIAACALVAVGCLSYFVLYSYFNQRTDKDYDELIALKEKAPVGSAAVSEEELVIHYTEDEERVIPPVLDEYKNLLIKNKKLIGWIKIDDTNIDYPVMQTTDNEYYLDHNLNQEYDKNGSIFMDKDCDVLKPSTNIILYGHHMKSGKMFGGLDKYSSPDYYLKHRYIDFDTIYEKGSYEVMYVFRSRVYSEEEVVFKYYQFIDAINEMEFDSNMREMAAVSLYDTGVTASYGDRLLTLSTCDYQEKNGRFVVVAKKVAKKE
ncbi:MAG: class B sortase [Lachnospiraceae bacterium]|nr:class B sortase [Lachnospiraceae bacterium]